MTVKDLICEWLKEAGKDKRAAQLAEELEENHFANLSVGADCAEVPYIRYVEKWGNEGSYVGLKVEPVE